MLALLGAGCSATEDGTADFQICVRDEPTEVGPYTVQLFDADAAPSYAYPNLAARLEEAIATKPIRVASSAADQVYHEDVTEAANDPEDLALRTIPEPCLPADCEGFLWTDAYYLAARDVRVLLVARRDGLPGGTKNTGRVTLPAFGAVALDDQGSLISSFAVWATDGSGASAKSMDEPDRKAFVDDLAAELRAEGSCD